VGCQKAIFFDPVLFIIYINDLPKISAQFNKWLLKVNILIGKTVFFGRNINKSYTYSTATRYTIGKT